MAVGKGSILRAGSANAAAKEKKSAEKKAAGQEKALPVEGMKESAAQVPLEALKEVPQRWKDGAVDVKKPAGLTESIKLYGVLVPVLVYQNKKQGLLILDGACRVEAAREAGLVQIPVFFVEAKTDARAEEIYRELRSFRKMCAPDREYEVISSITANLPDYLL